MTFLSRRVSVACTVFAATLSAVFYPFLPKRIATHFDLEGEADKYSARLSATVLLPAAMAGVFILNDHVGSWPGGEEREESETAREARDEAIALSELALLWSHLLALGKGLGLGFNLGRWNRAGFGTLMVALGNVMPRLDRNPLVGIRTPWTLADPVVWERTHQIGGRLLTAAGLVNLASIPSRGKIGKRLPVVSVIGAVVISSLYSYWVSIKEHSSGR